MTWISDNFGLSIPALLIIVGAVLGAIGAVLYNRQTNKQQEIILSKAEENAKLSRSIASRSDEIAELYKKISDQSNEIAELNKELAGSLTGGDSFCYLMPLPSFTEVHTIDFHLHHYGKYPMYDVKIIVWDTTINENVDFGKIFEKHFGFRKKTITMKEYLARSKEEMHDEVKKSAAFAKESLAIANRSKIVEKLIGTITHSLTRQNENIFSYTLPSDRDHQEFAVSIYARNGHFKQKFRFTVEHDQWQMESTLTKSISENENIILRELRRYADKPNTPWAVEIVQ